MKNLKSALGKDDDSQKIPTSSISNSLKSKKSDSSSSIWSIVEDLEDEGKNISIDNAKFMTEILETLAEYNKKGKPVE